MVEAYDPWKVSRESFQAMLPILLRIKDQKREDAIAKQKLTMLAQQEAQRSAEAKQKIMQDKKNAEIKYAQDMLKSAYERGDNEGVKTFGRFLEQQGLTVPGAAAPMQPAMTEAALTQRALAGDSSARAILEAMARRKAETAKAGASNVTVDVGEKSMEKLGQEMSKVLVEERKDVVGAVTSLENLKEAESLLDSGMITGAGAEFLTSAGNLLASRLGFQAAEDPVANTQAFAATMGTQVGQIIKQFGSGTGLSDADREYAEKIVGGKITLTEKAIRRLIGINKKAFKNVIKRYNAKAEQAMTRPGADTLPYDLRVPYKEDEEKKEETKPRFELVD